MTIFKTVTLTGPYLRVNNRNHNLAFYQETLGLRLLSEENALAFLGGHVAQTPRLTLEESPSYNFRAVVGTKKLRTLFLKASIGEIAELLARQVTVQQVYRGDLGYAFSAQSPEGHDIVLHGEEDINSLKPCDYPDLPANPNFIGLSDVSVSAVQLNVIDKAHSDLFYAGLPLSLETLEATGQDLQAPSNHTWDLEILEFAVAKDKDLTELKTHFDSLGAETFLNKKETILVVTDPSRIEIWFVK